jgi:hypothetical protein
VLQYVDSAIGFVMIILTISLVIMVIMQAVSSVLDLRGRNLIWAMEQLLRQISPEARDVPVQGKGTFSTWAKLLRARFAKISVPEDIAHAIANHPTLTSNASSLATAIRPEEILDVLQAIRDGKGRQRFTDLDTNVQAQINRLLQPVESATADVEAVNNALSAIDRLVPGQAAEVKKVLNTAVAATSSAAIEKVMTAVKAQAAEKAEAIEKAVQERIQNATVLEQGLEKWFSTVMDHASSRFTKHNRFWTLVIAVGLTVFFRIDSIEVFTRIFAHPELRATLVNAADEAQKQDVEILRRQHVGTQALQDMIAQGKLSDAVKTALAKAPLPNQDTCADGNEYLRGIPSVTGEEVNAYDTICTNTLKATLDGVSSNIKQLSDRLDSQDLRVFNQVQWSNLRGGAVARTALVREFWPHLRGLILTILLLSLGAPFWFDALKNLVSLRPAIANKVDREAAATTR